MVVRVAMVVAALRPLVVLASLVVVASWVVASSVVVFVLEMGRVVRRLRLVSDATMDGPYDNIGSLDFVAEPILYVKKDAYALYPQRRARGHTDVGYPNCSRCPRPTLTQL